ncbi:D-inositol 3-phosphate glycosyltransferase [bacterium HR26]|nr:D-inositol 3-phosphate glycosyltransferase [bacterium HR26]
MHEYVRRIAFISEHASPAASLGGEDAGGQNVYVDDLSRHLSRLGYAVDIFTRRTSPDQPVVLDWAPGVRIVYLDAGRPSPLPKDQLWPWMPDLRDAFLRFLAENRAWYDVIHAHFWMSGWVAIELKRRLGIPVVQTFHALGQTKRRHQGEADTSPPARLVIERAIVQRADRLIAQCPSERRELMHDYDANSAQLTMVPAGVDTELFHPVDQATARHKLGLGTAERVVVYVGRILPRKDVRNVLQALALLIRTNGQPVRLLVVGGETPEPDPQATPELGTLQQLAAELGIAEHVTFTGRRPRSELAWYYGAADVAVTTPWYEPFGLTPLEAMACGRAVIGSAVGGIAFTVQPGVTGFLVPPRDPEALARRLVQLLAASELRARMGQAARLRVEREFTWERTARRMASVYEEVLRETGMPPYEAGADGRAHRPSTVHRQPSVARWRIYHGVR